MPGQISISLAFGPKSTILPTRGSTPPFSASFLPKLMISGPIFDLKFVPPDLLSSALGGTLAQTLRGSGTLAVTGAHATLDPPRQAGWPAAGVINLHFRSNPDNPVFSRRESRASGFRHRALSKLEERCPKFDFFHGPPFPATNVPFLGPSVSIVATLGPPMG